MAEYDFSTLNSSDFEELACDLMNLNRSKSTSIEYKTFKDGKDKGIDFLYSTSKKKYNHVGQAKHYYRTGYSGMFSVLKDSELEKVKKLNPNKYFFFTSIDLNVSQTEEIDRLFKPYIKTLNDIYGKKDINKLIQKHQSILESHFKLWLNDFTNLKKILESDMEFRSADFIGDELKKRIRLFIKPKRFDQAKKSLEENKVLIITGNPGVGKTTLAEMLAYDFILKDYKFTYVLEDVKEVEDSLSPDDSKQIIYFDDFLGSNSVEINKAQGSEAKLIKVIKRIQKKKNKHLILTTRSLILKVVNEESDKLERYGITSSKNIFQISDYDQDKREGLLRNHIEISNLKDEYKEVLGKKNIIHFITNHKNFAPRSIEFITSNLSVQDIEASDYEQFLKKNFDYPSEIWRHAYEKQINFEERILLNTLFSFASPPSRIELERAFYERINHEVKNNNYTKGINLFRQTLRRTEGGLIIFKKGTFDFINPSLKDFLSKYLLEDRNEINTIVNSIVYVTQFSNQLFNNPNYLTKLPLELDHRLNTNYQSFHREEYRYYDNDLINLATVVKKFSDSKQKSITIVKIINEIDDWSYLHEDFDLKSKFKEFIQLVENDYEIMEIVAEKSSEIVRELVLGEDSVEGAIDMLSELSETFKISYGFEFSSELTEHFDRLFSELIDNEVEWLKDWITDPGEVEEKEEEITNLVSRINEIGFEYKLDLIEFDIDWSEVARNNEFRRLMEKDD